MVSEGCFYPLIIVGAGPIGLACALEASKHGISYLILEKGTVVNSIYNYPVNMTFFSTSDRLEIGNVPFISAMPKPRRLEALEYYRRVAAANNLRMRLFEEVRSINKVAEDQTARFRINSLGKDGKERIYFSSFVIVATGFYDLPYLLNVPGEELSKVRHYYDDPHFYAFQKIVVVGAQNSAVDAALETWRKGADVTMVIRGPEIGERVKYWVRPEIINRISDGSINAYFNATVECITSDSVEIVTPERKVSIANDWVLALTGYQPNLDFLRSAGVEICDDEVCEPTVNEKTHETNQRGLYLAGVICGGLNTHRLFIENSRGHATAIIDDIVKQYV